MFCHTHTLGLEAAFDMVAAPQGRTFFYRNMDKRVIEAKVLSEHRLHSVKGPLVYGVTDSVGVLRYVGKWVSKTPLYARWFRHEFLHHQSSSRAYYLIELDRGRGPLRVWSASVAELRPRLGSAGGRSDTELAEALEALWITRWKPQLWNRQTPTVPAGFTDGEYWRNEL
jgi:hypothetical protein